MTPTLSFIPCYIYDDELDCVRDAVIRTLGVWVGRGKTGKETKGVLTLVGLAGAGIYNPT